ncbi:Nicalin-1 [Pseudolycoriella hygida]|uniref:Nicalin-1 n=1 Tax=Pseudolycoriella hygida TaxID=35572 RepID=A0A9Q0RXI9_9DIPT|nr:Nicalin-1 [Pseudolycoriella hygida]
MFEDADNFADLFRGGFSVLLVTLPFLIILSSTPVLASNEFTIDRMTQYDVHGVAYGCRASNLNLEAKSLQTWTTSRHCVITRFQDLTVDQFREIRAKAGGIIILLPENLSILSSEEKQHIYMLEQAIMAQEISIPVYFSKYNPELNDIIDEISTSKEKQETSKNNKRESALSEIVNSISANGYQIVVSGASHSVNKQSKIPIIQGELAPVKNMKEGSVEKNTKLPLLIVTAHFDNFGLINHQLPNLDVTVFMSLVSAFSKIHSSPNTSPKYRIMFLLSESGTLLNFQGMKKWLDTNLDENMQIQNAEFVLCIDGIGQQSDTDTMYMHVSKPPKEGTSMSNFFKQLRATAQKYENVTVEGVHKKINLADVQLAWEHERFSMKRMPAFTLSSLKSHKDPLRSTIFVENQESHLQSAQRNAKILAEALGAYVFGNNNGELFSGASAISKELVKPWLYIRSTQVNNDLKNAFEKYLKNVKITYDKPDAREPDFMLYDGHDGTLNVYSVKPAVFDLFLTFVIVAYLSSVYLAIVSFPTFYDAICKMSNNKVKTN